MVKSHVATCVAPTVTKQSGNGRDKSLHAFDKYTEMKATWINLES